MTALPRILLLTAEPPHTAAAGALVFFRLFRDYPPERLLVVTNHPPPAGSHRLACRYEHRPLLADRLDRTRLWPWKPGLRSLGASGLTGLRRIHAAMHGFKPDLVVTLMQDSWYYDLAARYARAHDLPLALVIHDLPDGFEPVPRWLQLRQRERDAAVYRQAAVRLCVSRGMADWFQAGFGLPGEVLPPPRADSTPNQPPEACRALKTPGRLTLGYAGGLHYGYGEQLLAMLPMLRECGVRLELFTPPPGGKVAALRDATDVITFHGRTPTPEEAWHALLARCDAVVQPYLNPPGSHARQYRTHFPSKLGDCLALGLPLLVTGPADAAGVAWCLDHPGSALVVTAPEPAALATALGRLRDDAGTRVALARAAQSAAREFDAPFLRRRLLEHLLAVVR